MASTASYPGPPQVDLAKGAVAKTDLIGVHKALVRHQRVAIRTLLDVHQFDGSLLASRHDLLDEHCDQRSLCTIT